MRFENESHRGLLLRGGEIARELGISRALAYRWMATGVLPVVRVPGSKAVRVPREALMEWIQNHTQQEGKTLVPEESRGGAPDAAGSVAVERV
jgi:excisionase family DNA binding protein